MFSSDVLNLGSKIFIKIIKYSLSILKARETLKWQKLCRFVITIRDGCTILAKPHPHKPHKVRAKITQITSKTIIIDSVIINI